MNSNRTAVVIVLLMGLLLFPNNASTAGPQGQKKAQARAAAPAAPSYMSINVVKVKPDMLTEWQDFQKNETIPALKKAGVSFRSAWQTAIFGEAYEYVFITPIKSLAQYDDQSPIVRALGEEGARAYGAKARKFVTSSHTYCVRPRGDLSNDLPMTATPKLAIITEVQVTNGRATDFENFIKVEILPAMKKGKSGYYVSQTVYGGNVNDFVSVTLYDSFAEIGKGPVLIRVLGQDAFNKLGQKLVGIVERLERSIARYNADLSIAPPPPPAK